MLNPSTELLNSNLFFLNRSCSDQKLFGYTPETPNLCDYPIFYGVFNNVTYNCSDNVLIGDLFQEEGPKMQVSAAFAETVTC